MLDLETKYMEVIGRYFGAMEAALLHRHRAMELRLNRGRDDEETEAAAQESFQAVEQVREIGLELTVMLGQVRPDDPFGRLGLN